MTTATLNATAPANPVPLKQDAAVIGLVAMFLEGFVVDGLWAGIGAAIVTGIVSWIAGWFIGGDDRGHRTR